MKSRLPPRIKWKKSPKPPIKPWTKNPIVEPAVPDEGLTGIVKGQRASSYEERFARALGNSPSVEGFEFQLSYYAPAGVAGQVTLDFMVYAGLKYPIQIDGDWIHKSAAARAKDLESDGKINEILQGGAQPVQRIPGHKLEDQQMTNAVVEEMF